MDRVEPCPDALTDRILTAPRQGPRRLVALAGAPASGKTTLSRVLVEKLRAKGCAAQCVPMDGFHLDNRILEDRGLLTRKGAPETFDANGFLHLVKRIKSEAEVIYPIFDRARDIAIANAGLIDPSIETVVVEGNYLLFDAPVWRELSRHWDVSIRLDVPMDILEARLNQRWRDLGYVPKDAKRKTDENDLVNARRIQDKMLPADISA